MKRLLAAASAAVALACAGSAGAAPLFATSGSYGPDDQPPFLVGAMNTWTPYTPEFGDDVRIDFTYVSNNMAAPLSVAGVGSFYIFWDYGYAEHISQGSWVDIDPTVAASYWDDQITITPHANGLSAVFRKPKNTCADWVGTTSCDYADARGIDFRLAATPGDTMDWKITITAVPEPATWAMMIAGFGLAGVMLRRSRTVQSGLGLA